MWTFARNPAFAVWSAQNDLPSPHPLHWIVGWVLLALLALFAARLVWRRARRDVSYALILGWLVIVPILIYIPVNVQRRLSEAVIVPLAVVAALGLRLWARRFPRQRPIRAAWIGAALATSFVLLSGALIAASIPARPLFRPSAEIAAFDWLNANSQSGEIVLSSVATGNAIPAYTHLRPYMGHGPETLYWQDKRARLQAFFDGELSADERAALLDSPCADGWTCDPVRYVYYGETERTLTRDFPQSLGWSDSLTLIYDRGGVQIYRRD
jgi:hypothetical protein